MKQIALIFICFLNLSIFADSRYIIITCKAIIIKETETCETITGFTYSLRTGIKSEEAKDVKLDSLLTKIANVKWPGSVIFVALFSDQTLHIKYLSRIIIKAIENRNGGMDLVYMENGTWEDAGKDFKKMWNYR